jgi:3-oxoadipate CoA-transferase beta subunit
LNALAACKPLTRNEMAARLARDIPEGWFVNLGIGAPLQVADHVPAEREVIFHSENGVLGMGPAPEPERIDRWLINAGKQYVTLRTGGSYMHHADSFAPTVSRLFAAAISIFACSAPSKSPRTATSPTGRRPTTTPRPRLAVRWTLRPARGRFGS